MKIVSPLANFKDLLTQVNSSVSVYSSTLRSNEASTRAVLVDPVIRALGWNTANPAMVEVEKTFLAARVDYALYDSNGDVKVIIEAKKLGENLNNQSILLSLVNYAFTSEVKDIFLTDGVLWHHFSGFEPGKLSPSKILDIENDELVEVAAYLVQRLDAARYWPDEKDMDELSQKINQVQNSVSNLEKELSQTIKQLNDPNTKISKPEFGGRDPDKSEFTLLTNIGNAKDTKPAKLRLPDSTVVTVDSWSEVLRECVKFTLGSNPNISIPLPDRVGKKVNLLDKFQPQKGVSYVELSYKGEPIFLYENYDSNNCIANALYILGIVSKESNFVSPAIIFKRK